LLGSLPLLARDVLLNVIDEFDCVHSSRGMLNRLPIDRFTNRTYRPQKTTLSSGLNFLCFLFGADEGTELPPAFAQQILRWTHVNGQQRQQFFILLLGDDSRACVLPFSPRDDRRREVRETVDDAIPFALSAACKYPSSRLRVTWERPALTRVSRYFSRVARATRLAFVLPKNGNKFFSTVPLVLV
jgi:hypothetical protein